ncbi:hypothetical protein [Streptomyces yaizuensis]|uniref:Uncharacterized protein n=1 Tax=Streptomyces yaizuensis TaxID=2989713 RepID=A0ABQ5PBG5_9ACTN|nr:hypothetical protein [Streptomyces sp. YSPA8]GLF99940.1 hypothetical protein SYYSPA8_36605 [Streptomyces sp. YSPA8]
MNRSLTRNIISAARRTPDSTEPFTHLVEVEHLFPATAFADAPARWTPGEGFTEVAGGAWLRVNADGTRTAVVTGVGPKELPAADDGTWTGEEVWTVTSADPGVFTWLGDKPHRITRALGREDAEIVREPYEGHPAEAGETYWYSFGLKHGFTPVQRADGRYSLTLACAPNASWWNGPWRLVSASGRILKAHGGRAVVRTVTGAHLSATPATVDRMRLLSLI